MDRRGLFGLVTALGLAAFSGGRTGTAETSAVAGCACCEETCACPVCTCDAGTGKCSACDGCGKATCCSSQGTPNVNAELS